MFLTDDCSWLRPPSEQPNRGQALLISGFVLASPSRDVLSGSMLPVAKYPSSAPAPESREHFA